jgi:2-polyprenyl-3-methyl-5-hydroxy-6-metoxy-1,4-benzoquinol methylase
VEAKSSEDSLYAGGNRYIIVKTRNNLIVNSLVMRSVTSGPSQFDSDQFKIGLRQSWNNAAFGFENAATVVSDKLVELAGITAGHQILDLATGTGEPALTAAKKIAESKGHVLATDISPQMLAIAKQRAAAVDYKTELNSEKATQKYYKYLGHHSMQYFADGD